MKYLIVKINKLFLLIILFNICIIEFFEINILGLLFASLICIYLIKKNFNSGSLKYLDNLTSRFNFKLGEKSIITFVLIIAIAIILIISFIAISLEGSPLKIWPLINILFTIVLSLLLFEHFSNLKFLAVRILLIVIAIGFSYDYLNNTKALWPNKHGSIFGLNERSYNYIQSSGWDWGEETYIIPANPEEFKQMIAHFNKYKGIKGAPIVIKDTVKRIPNYSQIGLRYIDPFYKIKKECEHWYTPFIGQSYVKYGRSIYYDKTTEMVIINRITEM